MQTDSLKMLIPCSLVDFKWMERPELSACLLLGGSTGLVMTSSWADNATSIWGNPCKGFEVL